MENFPVVVSDFLQANALIQVQDVNGLKKALISLLSNMELRHGYGLRAGAVVRNGKGVVHNSVKLIAEVIKKGR